MRRARATAEPRPGGPGAARVVEADAESLRSTGMHEEAETRASDGKRESAREADTQLLENSRRKEAEKRPGLWLRNDSVHLTLLVRAYCHLCDEMRDALRPLAKAAGATITEIDVDADAAIEARFGDLVPVLLHGSIDGIELCHYRLDTAGVENALRDATQQSR